MFDSSTSNCQQGSHTYWSRLSRKKTFIHERKPLCGQYYAKWVLKKSERLILKSSLKCLVIVFNRSLFIFPFEVLSFWQPYTIPEGKKIKNILLHSLFLLFFQVDTSEAFISVEKEYALFLEDFPRYLPHPAFLV